MSAVELPVVPLKYLGVRLKGQSIEQVFTLIFLALIFPPSHPSLLSHLCSENSILRALRRGLKGLEHMRCRQEAQVQLLIPRSLDLRQYIPQYYPIKQQQRKWFFHPQPSFAQGCPLILQMAALTGPSQPCLIQFHQIFLSFYL